MHTGEISILVVDDVFAMLVQLKDLLQQSGFRKISAASSGMEAVELLQADEFHVILCDWQMSPMNGLQVLQYVRSSPKYRGTIFVMVTAESTKDKVVEAIRAGVDHYLVKPILLDDLQHKLYQVLIKKKVLS